jgi:hypothetical protein
MHFWIEVGIRRPKILNDLYLRIVDAAFSCKKKLRKFALRIFFLSFSKEYIISAKNTEYYSDLRSEGTFQENSTDKDNPGKNVFSRKISSPLERWFFRPNIFRGT